MSVHTLSLQGGLTSTWFQLTGNVSPTLYRVLKLLPMGGASDVAPAVLVEGDHKHKPRPANTH